MTSATILSDSLDFMRIGILKVSCLVSLVENIRKPSIIIGTCSLICRNHVNIGIAMFFVDFFRACLNKMKLKGVSPLLLNTLGNSQEMDMFL